MKYGMKENIFVKRIKVSGKCMILHNKELCGLYMPPTFDNEMYDGMIRWTCSEEGRTRNSCKVFVEELLGK